MGQAGKALRQVLETYSISQSSLATALGVDRPIVFRWFHEHTDPTAETVAGIVEVLRGINPDAAEAFIRLYLGGFSQSIETVSTSERQLPPSEDVNVAFLSGIFNKTTNSYKYLFFISILDILERRKFSISSSISFREIIIEMLFNALYPHIYFKLSFGKQDEITKKIDKLIIRIGDLKAKLTEVDKRDLHKKLENQDVDDILMHFRRFVPFLLIRPFFEQELSKIEPSKRRQPGQTEQHIIHLANSNFDLYKPLYYFDSDEYKRCKSIILHPSWVSYLETNYSIVRSWASWHWLQYMQERNPTTPAIVNKLFPPQERSSLNDQKIYWKKVFAHTEIRCIYSDELVDPRKFSLDHYIPWSFVGHDLPWNLIPTLPEVNSSKSNNLPSIQYFDKFVSLQHLSLTNLHEQLTEKNWNNHIDSFVSELKLSDEELLDKEKLRNAYESAITPQIALAVNRGFTPNWIYM
jgi:transcriptional regulator with XRE-family HTH domain